LDLARTSIPFFMLILAYDGLLGLSPNHSPTHSIRFPLSSFFFVAIIHGLSPLAKAMGVSGLFPEQARDISKGGLFYEPALPVVVFSPASEGRCGPVLRT